MLPKNPVIRCTLFAGPFLLWAFLCRNFFYNQLPLLSDAIPYYEHIRYYLENIQTGTYPLWDPLRYWGVPNDLFLRRFCEFNPFVYLTLVFKHLGLTYRAAYLAFLSVYFWLGLIGFYLLARKIYRDEILAWTAYILLLFTTLGATIFASYIVLLFVPFIWFFYFLWSFLTEPRRGAFLGLTFTLMIILNTYLPFYFAAILFFFLIASGIFYPREFSVTGERFLGFIRENRLFVVLCASVLVFSCLTGLQLFMEMRSGNIVLPSRHGLSFASGTKSSLNLDLTTIDTGGFLWLFVIKNLFLGLSQMKPMGLYIPLCSFLFLGMGAFAAMNRRVFFFAFWGLIIFFLTLGESTPVHEFCYKYIFFFRYFRNLQHFVWIFLLPLFILTVVEILRLLLFSPPRHQRDKILRTAQVLAVHIPAALFVLSRRTEIPASTLAVIVLSVLFFMRFYAWPGRKNTGVFLFLMALIIIPQSAEVYHFLKKNYPLENFATPYELPHTKFSFLRRGPLTPGEIATFSQMKPDFYLSSPWFFWLGERMNAATFNEYSRFKLKIYDQVSVTGETNDEMPFLTTTFAHNANLAFVPASQWTQLEAAPFEARIPWAQLVEENSDEISVQEFNANSLRIKTNFDRTRFLVYNDNYNPNWNVFIDGRKTTLFRTNIAFKGVLVPAGEHVILFRYGQPGTYILRYAILGLFWLVFLLLLKLSWNTRTASPADTNSIS